MARLLSISSQLKLRPMNDVVMVISRFPTHEFAARRCYASDVDFREMCENYATTRSALDRWKSDGGKAAEYRQLMRELEDEILAYLEQLRPAPKNRARQ